MEPGEKRRRVFSMVSMVRNILAPLYDRNLEIGGKRAQRGSQESSQSGEKQSSILAELHVLRAAIPLRNGRSL